MDPAASNSDTHLTRLWLPIQLLNMKCVCRTCNFRIIVTYL